jgi:hypothetical protein
MIADRQLVAQKNTVVNFTLWQDRQYLDLVNSFGVLPTENFLMPDSGDFCASLVASGATSLGHAAKGRVEPLMVVRLKAAFPIPARTYPRRFSLPFSLRRADTYQSPQLRRDTCGGWSGCSAMETRACTDGIRRRRRLRGGALARGCFAASRRRTRC